MTSTCTTFSAWTDNRISDRKDREIYEAVKNLFVLDLAHRCLDTRRDVLVVPLSA